MIFRAFSRHKSCCGDPGSDKLPLCAVQMAKRSGRTCTCIYVCSDPTDFTGAAAADCQRGADWELVVRPIESGVELFARAKGSGLFGIYTYTAL